MSLNLADLASLPPVTNVFDDLDETLRKTVFGDWSEGFWLQGWLLIGVLSFVAFSLVTALVLKWRRGRLRWLVHDGAATRPELRTIVPILWVAYSCLLIAHFLWMRADIKRFDLSPALAKFWWYEQGILTMTYLVISMSIIASAPAVRRALMALNGPSDIYTRFPPSTMLVFAILLLFCIGCFAGLTPAANMSASSFEELRIAFQKCQGVIEAARQSGDVNSLAALVPLMENLENAGNKNLRAQQIGGAIFTAYSIVHLISGVLPGIALNVFVKRKITKLERQAKERSLTSGMITTRSGGELSPGINKVDVVLPTIKKDAPFMNTLPAFTAVPPQFQTILDTRTATPATKAKRLRHALKQENRFISMYLMLLLFLSALSFYEACGGQARLSSVNQLILAFCWPAWSFVVPSSICAGLLMYDAFHKTVDDEFDGEGSQHQSTSGVKSAYPIQLTQTVAFAVEEVEMEKVSSPSKSAYSYGESSRGIV